LLVPRINPVPRLWGSIELDQRSVRPVPPPIRLYQPAPAPLPHAAEIALIYLKSRLGGPHAPYGLR